MEIELNKIKVLSLFDGMSVAQQALTELGIPVESYYASEIDPYAIAVTQSNFPNTIQLGSVVGLKLDEKIDLMIGGSPCQDLSIAKKNREGLKGQKSGLFYEYVRIRDEVKPKYFILENVNSMPKEAKEQISEILGVQPVMINASLVSAQNRKRLFWIGKWNGEKYEQVEIPLPEDRGIILKDILEGGMVDIDKSYCIDASYYKGANWKQYKEKGRRQLVIATLDEGTWSKRYEQIRRVYSEDGLAPTIPTGTGGGVIPKVARENTIRKLTPIECLRLQSMPDDYFDKAECKGRPISNTQRYKMCGNAFNCEVVKHIISQML